jgi:hypothetical protein
VIDEDTESGARVARRLREEIVILSGIAHVDAAA